MAKLPEPEPNQVNRISAGTEIKGNIKTNSDIRIDGILEGNISTAGKLVLGETGRIKGEISAKNSDIEGEVIGKITIKDLLSLKRTAVIQGDIITNRLAVEPGAKFSGHCEMINDDKKPAENKQQTEKTSA
jgi:cytoskeletal protein CcmA (bactofilin family)